MTTPTDPPAEPPTPTTPIQEVLLDDATVAQLFFDIAHAAQLIAVIEKGVGARRADAVQDPAALDAAHAAFAARRIGAVQLRYQFGGEEWWDTLTHTAAGVRLIRISHTRALAGSSG
jgi:hypothetical protein